MQEMGYKIDCQLLECRQVYIGIFLTENRAQPILNIALQQLVPHNLEQKQI